ncbi:hypothetical protein PaecuDRAFT_3699 [Paenibacillus curdlanolyticus YK9]|uniref:Immunity MXAN-0049 protein domain-containing protein n=2 Tax=Paenibacillus curdlanolyticus TaxID=59840 RepID=E0IDJ5_9BACL|nr:hypothetical protein PaecuDRAFT_3699 [Paenibacillus curdlanolyticus YK9]
MRLTTCDEQGDAVLDHFNGEPMASWYRPIKLSIQRKGKEHDFPAILPGVLIFSKKARTIVEPLVGEHVEFLAVDHSEMPDFEINMVNVTNVIDALDYEHTEFRYYSTGEMADYEKPAFQFDKIKNSPIFRVPERTVRIYVTDEFRDLVLKHKLKGLDFEEVWDSEVTDDMEQERQRQYEAHLAEIENNKGTEVGFDEAVAQAEAGKAMASGKWKLQADSTGNVLLGDLTFSGDYDWIDPIYYPPILLELRWHEVEPYPFED